MKGNLGKMVERLLVEERVPAFCVSEHVARYAFAGQFVEGKAVLDIACGDGYGASYLMNKGAKKVVGGDYSEEAIEYARRHYQKDGLNFLRLDAQEMPFANNSFDVVVSFETIEHLERYEDFLKGCRRVLKDDGIFICGTPNIKAGFGYKYPFHFKEFSLEEFNELIARHFAEVELYGQSFLNKADMIKRESIRRLGFIFCFIPYSVKGFLKRFIPPKLGLIASLAEVYPDFARGVDETLDKKYIPSLLSQGSPLCREMFAVSRKRDG